jgi:transposase InsO family protein
MSLLRPQPIPSQAFERVCCDFSGPYRESKMGNRYICVVTDYYSRYVIIWAMPSITAANFARDFHDHIICTQSVPKLTQTDRGCQFSSKVFTNLCKVFKIEQKFSPAFWPQSQGITERMNSTISAILRTFVNKEQTDWDVYLPSVAYAVNTSFSETLGQTPFYTLYGRMPINPAEINLPDPGRMPKQAYQILEDIVQNQTQAHSIATKKIEKAKSKMKERYDKKVFIPWALKIGSTVYLNKPIAQGKDLKRKLCSLFFGPYVITTFFPQG